MGWTGTRRAAPSNRRGLTLVEVLIALTVLAVFLLPVMIGFSQALITTSQSSTSAIASSVAREIVEDLKAAAYDSIQSSDGRWFVDLRPGDHYFQAQRTVTELEPNDASLKGIKQVEVSVYLTGSKTPMVTLTTYFTPVGV